MAAGVMSVRHLKPELLRAILEQLEAVDKGETTAIEVVGENLNLGGVSTEYVFPLMEGGATVIVSTHSLAKHLLDELER